MREFKYNPTITGKILKTKEEQFDSFFYQGHPLFLIPDFNPNPEDIWLSYMDFLETEYSGSPNEKLELYDQDGGEVHSIQILDPATGLTKCTYTAYGIVFDEDDDPQDIDVEIEGYVIEDGFDHFFVATKVFEMSKINE
jgi:hypothetical protein